MSEPVNYFVVSKRAPFRELVRFVLEWKFVCNVNTSDSESAALEYLRQTDVFPNMIIYEYESDAYLVEDFIAYIKESGKPVHFLVLADKIHGRAQDWFETQKYFHLIKTGELWDRVFTLSQESFKIATDNKEAWCRIHLDALSTLNGVSKDLYIKLPSGKLVRLFETGSVNAADIEKYRAKGLVFLWLERPTCDWVVAQIKKQFHIFVTNRNFNFVLRSPDSSKEEQFEQKIMRVCDELHIDPEFRDEIMVLMDKVLDAVMKDVRLGNLVKLIRNQDPRLSYFAREMQLMSLITCYLAKALEWHSKTTLEKLVYASILHDVTLATKPHLQCLTNPAQYDAVKDQLSEEDRKLYLAHPREAAQIVKSSFKFAPPETEVVILQHHELPDGSGFPGKVPAERLAPLTQLFIVTQDFVHYVMNDADPQLEIYFLRAEARFSHNTFRRYIQLLKKFKTNT